MPCSDLKTLTHRQREPSVLILKTPLKKIACDTTNFNDGVYNDFSNNVQAYSNNLCWIGLTRQQCIDQLQANNLRYIDFARWLAMPAFNLVLVFARGRCQQIEHGLLC